MKRILRGEALGSEQAQSSESLGHTHWFMSGHVRLRLCPKCKQTLAIHADGHRRCVCLVLNHLLCSGVAANSIARRVVTMSSV